MFDLWNILILLGLFIFAASFWNWRRQDEQARLHALALCKHHKLQFLDIARIKGFPTLTGGPGWQATFQFGFSSDGESRYEGTLLMRNLRLVDVELPVYRTAQDIDSEAVEPSEKSSNSKPNDDVIYSVSFGDKPRLH
ncbi:MAG: DUF3301 domain-containing protein [Idiomarina sp.]|nr:DUF3301 domain-containing protein [Idiomarina sp.]